MEFDIVGYVLISLTNFGNKLGTALHRAFETGAKSRGLIYSPTLWSRILIVRAFRAVAVDWWMPIRMCPEST